MACASTLYLNLETIFLGFMKSDVEAGYYNAAAKIKSILIIIVTSLGTVLLPRVSYYIEHSLDKEFRHITKKAINFTILLSVPLMVYFIIFAKEAIYFLSGSAYEGAIIPMQIIMPCLLFMGLTNTMGIQMLVPMGKEKYVLVSLIAGTVSALALSIALVPTFSTAGAAIAALSAEITVWIVQYFILRKDIFEVYNKIQYLSILEAVALGSLLSYGAKFLNLGNFLILVCSAIVFFGTYAVFLLIVKEPLVVEIFNQMKLAVIKSLGKKQ